MACRLETFDCRFQLTAGVALDAGTVDLTDGRVHQRVINQTRSRELNEIESAEQRQHNQTRSREQNEIESAERRQLQLENLEHSKTRWVKSEQRAHTLQNGMSVS